MNLTCYAFDRGATANLLRLVRRISNRVDLSKIAVVYRAAIDVLDLQANARAEGILDLCCFIPYDGSRWEFAAYQAGIDSMSPNAEGVIIVNDTAGRNYPFLDGDLKRFAREIDLSRSKVAPIIVGKVETTGEQFVFDGDTFDRWIRSNIFYINRPALTALGGLVFEPAVFLAPHYRSGKLAVGVPMSKELEGYLLRWMDPDSGKDGWLAHARRAGVSDSVRQGKLGSILLEKRLSARLAAAQAEFVGYEPTTRTFWHSLAVRLFFRTRRLRQRFGR